MKRFLLIACFSYALIWNGFAQETFPINDVQDRRTEAYAFTNANLYVDYQTKVSNATLLIKEGKVVRSGAGLSVPKGYTVIDLKGKYIYPSFIDMYSNYGLPTVKPAGFSWNAAEQIESATPGAYNANQAIKSEFRAAEVFKTDTAKAKGYRNIGFGLVNTFNPDGIARGTSSFVSLANETENKVVIDGAVATHYSFNKGSSTQYYPVSLMGAVALLRQTHFDAQWYPTRADVSFYDQSLEALNRFNQLPKIMEANDWQAVLRADKIGDELGYQYIIKSGGDAYQRVDAIKGTGATLIVPINFPKPYAVEDPYDAMLVSLEQMKHWELAPGNLAALASNNIPFAITIHGLADKSKFWPNLRKAIEAGLSESAALKALTYTPAQLLNLNKKVGTLQPGQLANFLVVSDSIFKEKTVIHENWVQGKRHTIKPIMDMDVEGKYTLNIAGRPDYQVTVTGKPVKATFKIVVNDTTDVKIKSKLSDRLISLSFDLNDEKEPGTIRLGGWPKGKDWQGTGQLVDGTNVSWNLKHTGPLDKEDEKKKEEKSKDEEADTTDEKGKIIYPFTAYGSEIVPTGGDLLIKNATVWTSESDGVMEQADVLVRNGKIAQIGKGLSASGAATIDGTGKHLTPGIIDEHSHIALFSVNDVATISSQVRMEDVVDAQDINVYRQLSGGVTAAQLLHGSANPVGGQSALIKLKWGTTADEMLIQGADPYIKFALGENVKRSRSTSSIRFPQTRMGVEQVFMDGFTRAQAYDKQWKAYNRLSPKVKARTTAPRRDLTLEALAEILNKERFVTCHSYVQSEINMLMKVAEQFNFNVNTFTHILEGYKVADKMKNHGVGASTFADWWAYKYEVIDAIPYNATLMNSQGVVTAINSDDAEMGRRLNQEAAKSVKYGNMSEEEALKMVTLNPAKLLHLEDRTGSIKVGKDADLVLWSDHPLSIYAVAQKTIVDGIIYFDRDKDAQLRKEIQAERARLTQKMIKAKGSGGSTQGPAPKKARNYHCEDLILNIQ